MQLNKNYKTLVDAYAQYLQSLGFASTTVYNYPRFIITFLHYLQNKNITHIKQLATTHIYTYYNYLEQATGKRTNKAFSTSHLNAQFLAIDKFLEFLQHIGTTNAPTPTNYGIEHKATKTIVVLTTEQIQTLYNTIPLLFTNKNIAKKEAYQACTSVVLNLCYGCGLRRAEALNLKIQHINFDTKTIHVVQGKNYKDRLVPMSEGVYKALQNFIYQHRNYFKTKRSHYVYPFKTKKISETLILLVKNSNDKTIQQLNPTLHSLRHSIATHLLHKGMNIDNIARFLGHSTLQSTQIYTHFNNEL